MTKTDAALHPGEYFIERRAKPGGQWEVLYRDNDEVVMQDRYLYQVEHLTAGQSLRFSDPTCKIICEESFDKAPAACEATL